MLKYKEVTGKNVDTILPFYLLYIKGHNVKLEEVPVLYQGGKQKEKILMKLTGKTYTVNINRNKEKYVIVQKKKVLLSTIRGKYNYLKK
jgi:hypothetical protein